MKSTKSFLFFSPRTAFNSLTCTIIECVDLMNIQVSESISLSQGTVGIQDGSDGVPTIFAETFTPVVHEGVKIIRDL